ncbi:MAG: magnesium transporter [Clostridiales bacterium]|nr:magnesium transporter [Clostridiales bacterium]
MNKILDLLKNEQFSSAVEVAQEFSPKDLATIFPSIEENKLIPFCRELPSDFLAAIILELDTDLQKRIIDGLKEEELENVLEEMTPQETVGLIEDLPENTALKIAEEEEIQVLINNRNFAVLKPLLAAENPTDLAAIVSNLPDDDLPLVFRLMPKDLAADTFVELDSDKQELLISKFNNVELKSLMDELFVDDMVDLVEEMPSNIVKRILAQSDDETRKYVNEILKYPADSAGSIMTVEYVYLRPDMTVEKAFAKIKKNAINKETIYNCYVVDKDNKLLGLVTAKDLMLADKETLIKDIMTDNVIYAQTTDDKENVARKISDYGFIAIPIVDDEKRLVGIVTVDDAMDVLKEENSEDIAKMSGIQASDKPYLKRSVFEIWRNRIPWLLVLMISATFTGLIINTFEARLNAISTVLFACVPMIMDTGGNAGSQASVTVIRSLALNELTTKDVFKVMWKEIRVSILIGVTLAIACFAKLMLIDNLLFGYEGYTFFRSFIVSLALALTVIIAKFVGCSLPLLAKKVKLDPAVVASPFITTIVDALSLILYCLLAVAMLS